MEREEIIALRKLTQQYAYASLQMHETISKKAGFRATDHKYLGFFLQKEKLTAGEFAALSGLTTGAVTALIDRYEKQKLVKRLHDPGDRRKVIVEPDTPKIMSLLSPYYKDFQADSEELIATFSGDEIKVLQSYFIKALELARQTNEKFK